MSKHTPGPWRKGSGRWVVADSPASLFGVSDEERRYYEGYLIAESISPENLAIIAAAPEMLEALKAIAEATMRRQLPITSEINDLAMAAIAKATLGGQ